MDAGAIITILTGAAGVVGGFFGGKRLGHTQAQALAVDTVELLTLAVGELRIQAGIKEQEIATLRGRIDILEGLVTQRAEVDEVRLIVDKIAQKVGA